MHKFNLRILILFIVIICSTHYVAQAQLLRNLANNFLGIHQPMPQTGPAGAHNNRRFHGGNRLVAPANPPSRLVVNEPRNTVARDLYAPARLTTALSTTNLPSLAPVPPANTNLPLTAANVAATSYAAPTPTTVTASSPVTTRAIASPTSQPQHAQPLSFKFTLIAGKLWKFNIKPNSFTSLNSESGELRLHKNISANNFIIDDDGWFQYNPQSQQLFAWPSLSTKSGTYYFVLLPSGIDVEADAENIVPIDVKASIVVELIRPYQPDNARQDVDQLVDHKFSLENLQRHSSYPLLLQQILSVLEVVANATSGSDTAGNQLNSQLTSLITSTVTTTSAPSTTSNIIKLSNQLRYNKLTAKFNEILLISYSYADDGESFSVSWSSHPSLSNNTLSRIGDCRLNVINDIVSKLSNSSSGYQDRADRDIVYYPIDALSVPSLSASISERVNALKLVLNDQCQDDKTFAALRLTTSTFVPTQSTTTTISPAISTLFVVAHNDSSPPNSSETKNYSSLAKSYTNFLTDLPMHLDMNSQSNNTMPVPPINQTSTSDKLVITTTSTLSPLQTTYPAVSVVPSTVKTGSAPESSLNEDFIGILNEVTDYLISVAVPLAIIIGVILLISIFIAACSLCRKRRQSKKVSGRDRFSFRYGSERKAFLRSSSKPVILEADEKSMTSLTPQKRLEKTPTKRMAHKTVDSITYVPMNAFANQPARSGPAIGETSRDVNQPAASSSQVTTFDCDGHVHNGIDRETGHEDSLQ